RAKLVLHKVDNFVGAAPRKCEAGAAVTVVVNDGAAVAQTIAFEADAWFAGWAQAHAFGENLRIADLQDAAAFGDDARCNRWIDLAIIAHFVRAAENAVIRARDGVHQRREGGDTRATP